MQTLLLNLGIDGSRFTAFEKILIILYALSIITIPVVVYKVVKADKQWQQFVEEHHCIKSTRSSDISKLIYHNGEPLLHMHTSMMTKPETMWKCDGEQYYKW